MADNAPSASPDASTPPAAPAGDSQPKAHTRDSILKLIEGDVPQVSAKQPDKAPDNSAPGKDDGASGGADNQKPDSKPDDGKPAQDGKKQKDDERFDRNWKKFQEEKRAFFEAQKKNEADLRELEEFRKSKLTIDSDSQAREFDRIAQEFESEGNADAAALARRKALESRQQAQAKLQEDAQRRFMDQWRSNYEKTAEENQELFDEESSLYKGVENLLKAEPVLRSMPDGIQKAVSFVKNMLAAQDAEKLKADIAAKEKRIAELEQKLTPGGAPPASISSSNNFDGMSQKDRKSWLLEQMLKGER